VRRDGGGRGRGRGAVDGLEETAPQPAASAAGESDPFGRGYCEKAFEPRFPAIAVRPALFHIQGGLVVDAHERVLDAGRSPSPASTRPAARRRVSPATEPGGHARNGLLLPPFGLACLAAGHVAVEHATR
jgi:fumarate reductase flavoprotein subunit